MVKENWITKQQAARQVFPDIQPRVASGSLAGPKGYVISWVENQLQALGGVQMFDQVLS